MPTKLKLSTKCNKRWKVPWPWGWAIGLFLVAVVGASCAPIRPSASQSQPTPTASASIASRSATPGGICDAVSPTQLSAITGQSTAIDIGSSNADACTYAVGSASTAASYFILLRLEDGFSDLAGVRSAFGGGQEISGFADGAYWSSAVHVLWFETHGALYAVQLTNFDEQAGDALALARAVAEAALTNL